ncbi:aminodeoxychorismate lyase [Chromobacterium haemolyticum]|uniref:aminodeoxychorismate lyase n=1 Tax=Chromobacterium haemolyticum TaxID=394935 RepID=UPI00307E7763
MAMLINGRADEGVAAADRGLAYGDGVFRTLELREGKPRLWAWQYARLCDDARRLRLPPPEESLLLAELAAAGDGLPRAAAKIMLTRGAGARGYAMPEAPSCTRIVSAAAWNGYPPERSEQGVTARWCETRLALQPALAGIKHLNRLENVLARSEWQDPAVAEGLMLDMEGWVAEGTMSNVYVLEGEAIVTPRLDRCGVNGAVRDWLTAYCLDIGRSFTETRLSTSRLIDADAVFLSNSLMGIWQITRLGERSWTPHPLLRALQHSLSLQA